MNSEQPLANPHEIALAGERIYAENYQAEYEVQYPGHFVAIDVLSKKAYVAQFADDVLQKARKEAPAGVFHLIRIGSAGAFRVSYAGKNAAHEWVF